MARSMSGHEYGMRLFDQHAALLKGSAIDPEVAAERGYVTVDTKTRLEKLGFSPAQRIVPTLLVPVYDEHGEVALYQHRPDDPRRNSTGKPIKYETPNKARMVVDVPPRVREKLGDPSIPLTVTEGVRKADAAVSHGLACIALLGVWNWRGSNDEGGLTALAFWESVALNGRSVYIAFDSDVMTKPAVHDALTRLGAFLTRRGAEVAYIYLPPEPDGRKVGLDDHFAEGRTVADLVLHARPNPVTRDEEKPKVAMPTAEGRERGLVTDGADLLERVRAAVTEFVVLPSAEAADSAALWAAATHAQPAWEHATRLRITGPEKRCGKSRLLEVIEGMAHHPLATANATVAAIYRSIDEHDPRTLFFDEYDTLFGTKKAADDNEDLRALLNAGFRRGKPVLRCDGPNNDVREFPSFAMAALAGIGDLPDTVEDRSVSIHLRRRAPHEKVKPLRAKRDVPRLHQLRAELSEWLRAHLDELMDAEPEMPVEDRAADTWEPLVAVADLAGGDWPKRARAAAKVFNDVAEEVSATDKVATRLLVDLRTVFGDHDKLHTETVLEALHKLDDAGWNDYFGRPFGSRDLSKILKPYGVAPRDVKVDGTNKKGYLRDELWDVWQRYLPQHPPTQSKSGDPSATSATSATPQVNAVADETAVADISATFQRPREASASRSGEVADTSATRNLSATHLTSAVAEVAEVADTWPARETGPCVRCGTPHHRYGTGGAALCLMCRTAAPERRAS